MEAAWAVVAAVSAWAEKCVSPLSHYKPTADLTSLTLKKAKRPPGRASPEKASESSDAPRIVPEAA